MRRVDYDARLAGVYAKGRGLDAAALGRWLDVFAAWAPPSVGLAVDVGSGIGRFTAGLAARFGRAVGVEPSAGMRAQSPEAPSTTYVGGSAEAIPLRTGCADLALLFFVWHHVPDRPRAAAELARVLRPGGRVLLRTGFGDAMPDLWWYRWFPRAAEIDAAMYEHRAVTLSTFAAAGFEVVEEVLVEEPGPTTAAASFERLQARAISTFEHLTEEEIVEGFAAIERGLATDPPLEPLGARGPLLVLRRP